MFKLIKLKNLKLFSKLIMKKASENLKTIKAFYVKENYNKKQPHKKHSSFY